MQKLSTVTRTDTETCRACRLTLPVPPGARTIQCPGCQGIISVGNSQLSVSSWISKWSSEDQHNRKGIGDFYRKMSSSISSRNSSSFNQRPTAVISAAPPRGKRALLCGVSYKNTRFKLRGTTQDVMNMGKLLVQQFSFPTDSILVLAEDTSYKPPTRDNILQAFNWLMTGLQSGDSLVFHFSGHGLRQYNFNGDEKDGFDEAICPLDFETAGMIIDDDINKMIVGPLESGVKLHAIIDACHSGTVLDLPQVYEYDRNKGGKWIQNPVSSAYKCRGKAICFSACEDHQEAADTSAFSSEMAGALTVTFIKAVTGSQGITYRGILDYMHKAIGEANKSQRGCGMLNRVFYRKMLQDPTLSSSEPFNVDSVFKL